MGTQGARPKNTSLSDWKEIEFSVIITSNWLIKISLPESKIHSYTKQT